eukprot:Skav210110  [mRNA]  locus=scaffold2194:49886:55791:+ [translate_table: standard]
MQRRLGSAGFSEVYPSGNIFKAAESGNVLAMRQILQQSPTAVQESGVWIGRAPWELRSPTASTASCAVRVCTPLHLAAVNGHAAAAELLLEHRASLEAKDRYGPGPRNGGRLHGVGLGETPWPQPSGADPGGCAASESVAEREQFLTAKWTLVSLDWNRCHTKLMVKALRTCPAKEAEAARRAATHKAKADHFMSAASAQITTVMTLLVKASPRISQADAEAARHAADPDAAAAEDCLALRGETPLHFAAHRGHAAVAQLLLEHRASLEARDCNGPGPRKGGRQHTVGRGIARRPRRSGAAPAAAEPCSGARDQRPRPRQHHRRSHPRQPAGRAALPAAEPRSGARDERRRSGGDAPLHYAAFAGHAAVAQLLLEHRASLEAGDALGPGPRNGGMWRL